jgi:hypothetical protein
MNLEREFPVRHSNHSLEARSIAFFQRHAPPTWNVNSIDHDYGQDLNLEISEDGKFQGLDLIVQLKSSADPSIQNEFETQAFRISTYNYLWDNVRVAMIVKYVASEDEAYWILLRNIEAPNQDNASFTIYLPRENRLSTIDWDEIAKYVRRVTDAKLDVFRKD